MSYPLAVPDAGVGHDPWWVILIKVLFIFVFLVVLTLFNIWWERRVVARMQHRIGPNVHGPAGLLQSLADGVKLMLKEDLMPKGVDRFVFVLAPAIVAIPAFLTFAVIPFGPTVKIPFTDTYTRLQLTDLPVSVLYVMAIASIGIYGIVLGGWSSNSTYSLLGGLRSSAQMISYEVAMGLALVTVFLFAGSMSTSEIVAAQSHQTVHWFGASIPLPGWYAFLLFPSFVIYVISMIGETNRAPFDLPEAEGELVAGFLTEYSSIKYAMFFLAEYINMATVSALATTLFLGGWRAPWPISIWDGATPVLAGAVVHGQDDVLHLLLHLAARNAAATALRPVHEARLEDPDPGLAGLDPAGRDRARGRPGDQLQPDHAAGRGRGGAGPRGDQHVRPAEAEAGAADRGGPREGLRRVRRRVPGATAAPQCWQGSTVRADIEGRQSWLVSKSPSGIRSPGSGSPSGRCSARCSPSSTRSRRSRPRHGSTAGTS